MTREERLRKVIPGASDEMIAVHAAKPLAEVIQIVAALRQARHDALAHDQERKRQRKADDRKHGNYDAAQLGERNLRLLDSAGKRASADLEALAWLGQSARHTDKLIAMAVRDQRAQGRSDEEIGAALGRTRQAIGQRFGRKGTFTPEARKTGGAA